jgi:two-component system chemotaxis response regulator CheB
MQTSRLLEATCPDCRGPLTAVSDNGVVEYLCLVEHRYSPLALLAAHSDTQERALWAAVLVLEEAAIIARHVASQVPALSESLRQQGEDKARQADTIRQVLDGLIPFTID